MGKIIDGKKIAMEIKDELKMQTEGLRASGIIPKLAIIEVGDDAASYLYIKGKLKDCEYIGIESAFYHLPYVTDEETLLELIEELNSDESVSGIIVQLPLPKHISEQKIADAISPEKDVDGFTPTNVGNLFLGNETLECCTPSGIIELLKRSGITIEGKECVVIGRSNIVGKPIAALLTRENGIVTLAHSYAKDLKTITLRGDILVVATGVPKLITKEYIKEGAVVVDVGIHRINDRTCGDVNFDDVIKRASAVTPVPGGVGVMTRAMLMKNCIKAATLRKEESKCGL